MYGEHSTVSVTPQDLRKWNTTYLSEHPDDKVRAMRAEATGNTNSVFEQHYDLTRQAKIVGALMTCLQRHTDKTQHLSWNKDIEQQRRIDQRAIEKANEAVMFQPEWVDLTSRAKPVHRHLRNMFRRELKFLQPGHAQRAGTHLNKETGLSEWKWIDKVIDVLGREDAENLCNIIVEQYRGDENPAKRQWSGMCTHIEKMKVPGGEKRNCPLVESLKQFYSSMRSSNKNAVVMEGMSSESSDESED